MSNLQSLAVENLLGEFNHSFAFNEGKELVILHGPNGVGKTKLLELLTATLSFDIFKIAEVKFSKISLLFDDGVELTIINQRRTSGEALDLLFSMHGGEYGKHQIEGHLHAPIEDLPPSILRDLENEMRQMLSVDANPSAKLRALEHATGLYLSLATRRLRQEPRRGFFSGLESFDPKIAEYLDQFSVHMVETQRLLVFERNSENSRKRPAESSFPQRMRVSECARDLASRLTAALTENSTVSQELDKSFPRRVLDTSGDESVPSENVIRDTYDQQSALRNRLSQVALLDDSMDVQLPDNELLPWQRKVLWTYLEDSQRKLDSFRGLLVRLELFREIIAKRFQFKRMMVDRRSGLRFTNGRGDTIAPHQLSSGEQHMLVLLYDLLFEVQPGSLVLIDEPEISLHVAWQLAFLEDIRRIAQVSEFRFIVATHSPQIVNEWWSETAALGAVTTEEDES